MNAFAELNLVFWRVLRDVVVDGKKLEIDAGPHFFKLAS